MNVTVTETVTVSVSVSAWVDDMAELRRRSLLDEDLNGKEFEGYVMQVDRGRQVGANQYVASSSLS